MCRYSLNTHRTLRSMPCSSPADAQALRNFVNAHAFHPNQLLYDSRAFVSTFAGESCAFGQGSVAEGWKTQFAKHPELQDKIYFVPAFFIDPAKFGEFREVMDGDFNVSFGSFVGSWKNILKLEACSGTQAGLSKSLPPSWMPLLLRNVRKTRMTVAKS